MSDIIKESYIQLDKNASSFEEAIDISMKPLLNDGSIEQEYIDSIISIAREIGPYIVITKHVALPHAPSENGANRLAITFTRLSNPILSGNKANDPVKYLFGLSTTNSEEHLEILSELVNLLGNEDYMEFIGKVKSSSEFLEFLNKYEGIGLNG